MKLQENINKADAGFFDVLKSLVKEPDVIGTGIAGSSKSQLLMIPGRLIQGARNKRFINQFIYEVDELKKLGKISDDIFNSELGISSLQQLLAALENPPVDEEKFAALKALLLSIALCEQPDQNELRHSLLMEIVGGMSTGEILVLSASYRCGLETRGQQQTVENKHISVIEWRQHIADISGLEILELVESYESKLVEKYLLTNWAYPDSSGAKIGVRGRLTELGLAICEAWNTYNHEIDGI